MSPGQPSRPLFRPQSQNPRPTNPIRRYDGPIFLPPQIYSLLSEDALKALKAYNTEAISRFHKRKVHNTEIVEEPQDDPPGPPVSDNDLPDLPESDLNIPDDPILDFVNSQCHSSEELDQALQAYQAFQIPCPQDSTMTPERSINHHFTYHVAQASQAKHSSLVDRGANGGLAGSDVRILSRSSRKCTVTGIDSHELQGLDVVQCAALVQTNHGIVNLIMNEYAWYGKGHTIHSSGQIEWFKNSVDDRSVQVVGKQRICTTDGYAIPLTCRGGLMYLSLLGKPTDQDLERYPAVHLTGPHKWDPSVLDYTHPSGDGEPPWSNDPDERYAFDPNFDEFGDNTQRSIQTLSILDDSSSTFTPYPTFIAIQNEFRTYQPVFYATYDQHFPSESEERAGYWVGFVEHCGDAMTHKILDQETQKNIYRSAVRPKKSSTPNHGLAPHGGEVLHLLTLLKIKFPLDHQLEPQKVPHRNKRPPQSSSGPEMERIHLDPSLCLHLTLVTSLVGLSYFHLRKMGRGIEPRLPEKLLKLLTRKMVKE